MEQGTVEQALEPWTINKLAFEDRPGKEGCPGKGRLTGESQTARSAINQHAPSMYDRGMGPLTVYDDTMIRLVDTSQHRFV